MNLHLKFSLNSYRNQKIYKCGPSKIIHIITFLPFWVQTWQHMLVCHDYSQNTCRYCVTYFQVFWHCHNNWDASTIFDNPYMPKLFYYYQFIFVPSLLLSIWYCTFFKIKQFKWCVNNVWTLMHLSTHFMKSENCWIMTMWIL
jgi:hypothetical protein